MVLWSLTSPWARPCPIDCNQSLVNINNKCIYLNVALCFKYQQIYLSKCWLAFQVIHMLHCSFMTVVPILSKKLWVYIYMFEFEYAIICYLYYVGYNQDSLQACKRFLATGLKRHRIVREFERSWWMLIINLSFPFIVDKSFSMICELLDPSKADWWPKQFSCYRIC